MDQALSCSPDYPNSLEFYIPFDTMPQMDSFLIMLDVHYCMQILPSVGNPPNWMVYPSHTFSTYPQELDSPFRFDHIIENDTFY